MAWRLDKFLGKRLNGPKIETERIQTCILQTTWRYLTKSTHGLFKVIIMYPTARSPHNFRGRVRLFVVRILCQMYFYVNFYTVNIR